MYHVYWTITFLYFELCAQTGNTEGNVDNEDCEDNDCALEDKEKEVDSWFVADPYDYTFPNILESETVCIPETVASMATTTINEEATTVNDVSVPKHELISTVDNKMTDVDANAAMDTADEWQYTLDDFYNMVCKFEPWNLGDARSDFIYFLTITYNINDQHIFSSE